MAVVGAEFKAAIRQFKGGLPGPGNFYPWQHRNGNRIGSKIVDVDKIEQPILWYFADPMCSWCWGFSPVIARVKEEYGDRIRLSLNLGGLRPGASPPMAETQRQEILHH